MHRHPSSRRVRGRGWAAVALLLLGPGPAGAQVPPVRVSPPALANRITLTARLRPADPFAPGNAAGAALKEVRRGEVVRLTITGVPQAGFHTYPLTRRTPGQDEVGLSQLTYEESDSFRPVWPLTETDPQPVDEGAEGVWLEHVRPFTWSQDVLVQPGAKPGPATLKFTARLQVCAADCLTGELTFALPLTVSGEAALPVGPDLAARLKAPRPAPKVVAVDPEKVARGDEAAGDQAGGPARGPDSGLLGFILQGVLWGAVSLLTPCVFPMIPITVSFFLKQSEKERHRPLLLATAYCATIVAVLTASAVALLSVFQAVSTHPLTNFFLGALFVFFALSLFGMYDIELPAALAGFTSRREGRGGLVGTVFMALTFTIISFACVAPFLGGFGGTAAAGGSALSWLHRILGGLAFSATFASPFFLLALFPSLLRKLPKSGGWLNSVKVVMGFLELAAALAFFRCGELTWLSEPAYFTFDLVLAAYVGIALLCGLYLLNFYSLPHDTPPQALGVPRMLCGLAFIALGLYLAPGLLKSYDPEHDAWDSQRPRGVVFSWVESFLLPDPGPQLSWHRTLDGALAEARRTGRLVFVDFTGVTCKNCAYNERNHFGQRDVKALLGKYVRVQLYTDRVPNKLYTEEELEALGGVAAQKEEAARNRRLQGERFDDTRLPLYVILRPTPGGGYREVARYREGKINDPSAFASFLRRPLRPAGVAKR
jgi:thiol:disulfide interchange protein